MKKKQRYEYRQLGHSRQVIYKFAKEITLRASARAPLYALPLVCMTIIMLGSSSS